MVLSKHESKAFGIAIYVALKSTMRHKHGAVIFKRSKIISQGCNQNKTHPLAKIYYKYPHIHAELQAVLQSHIDIEGCSIAIVRINKNSGRLLMSLPCKGCMRLLRERGIKTIIYSTNGGVKSIRI